MRPAFPTHLDPSETPAEEDRTPDERPEDLPEDVDQHDEDCGEC